MFHFRTAAIAALVTLATVLPAAALDRRVTIINNTGYTIVNFFGSNTGTTSWEEDILGNDVLPSGSSVQINFNDGTGYCMFDFLAIFDDGEQLIREGVNICEISTFTYN
ncbi:MAG: hypothetical protein ACRCS3_02970 [Paracoccaceae bacterium]